MIGTIRLEELEATGANGVTMADFTLAAAAPTTTITGTDAANTTQRGGATSETINALGGNDTVNGNGGNDVVNGGEGADTLNGGDGNDTLSGGAGSNVGTLRRQLRQPSLYANNDGTVAFAGNWTEGGGETTDARWRRHPDRRAAVCSSTKVSTVAKRSSARVNLTGATSASVSFTYEDDNLGAGQSVTVQAWNATANAWQNLRHRPRTDTAYHRHVQCHADRRTDRSEFGHPLPSRAGNWDNGDNFYIDNFAVNVTVPGLNAGVDTVNGDAGDDTIIWNANCGGSDRRPRHRQRRNRRRRRRHLRHHRQRRPPKPTASTR